MPGKTYANCNFKQFILYLTTSADRWEIDYNFLTLTTPPDKFDQAIELG